MLSKASRTIVDTVKQTFDSDPLKVTFLDVICAQMSDRTITSLNPRELHDFIELLYSFFIVEHHDKSHIYFGKPELKSTTLTNTYILKMSHPDASHLFITLEEILRKHRLRTTRRLHPVIGIKRDETGEIIEIVSPTESDERRSLVFIAFEQLSNSNLVPLIKKDLAFHMNCVQQSQIDSMSIENQRSIVRQELQTLKPSVSSEWVQLLEWLGEHNFSFFGCQVINRDQKKVTRAFGICQKKIGVESLYSPSDDVLDHHNEAPFIVDRTTIISPIQRFEPLMKVSFKFKTTQYIFYGILKRSSMYAKNIDTPLINKKMDYIFNQRRFLIGSYDYNEVIRIFNDIPKFELFRTTKESLLEMVDFIMSITNPNHIQCYKKYNASTKQLRMYFVIPYYLFGSDTVRLISSTICDQLDYSFREILPISAPEKCRIHFHFKLNQPPKLPEIDHLERTLTQLVQPWDDQFLNHVVYKAPQLLDIDPHLIEKIPSHYKVRTQPESALRDIQSLLSLSDDSPIFFELASFDYPTSSDLAGKASMLLVYHRQKLDLTNILPILHNFGIHVIDQITSRFGDSESTTGYILAFRLLDSKKKKLNESAIKPRLIQALTDVFQETLPNDPLNQLVLSTALTSNEIFILQGLRNYMHQVFSSNYSLSSINHAIIHHPEFANALAQLFQSKFNPKTDKQQRLSAIISLTDELQLAIKKVDQIVDDEILRRLMSLVTACARTNAFIRSTGDALSFKFDCHQIFGMPTPVPFRETFVFDYHLEGVHIRFGAIARGGLRFSNRQDDYRMEILGLAKTQQTKNAVIIPVGAKGGFIVKHFPTITHNDSIIQYKRFITALLQIADNLINEKKAPNPSLICYDDWDPYFVVAADKGTATFSDHANAVSLNRQFWLGDGFASGGEHGYDHKKVGITAKGAWECTKLHFKSLQLNPEKDPITVAAIGDMGGDVFGNGMLLSKSLRLVAAFNHMHIMIDPTPNAAESFKERKRLFNLPKSTWKDYTCISAGGGVFDRHAKEIKCSKEMKALLNISEATISGEHLIQCILKSQVDLIWFGGIGTYIKATSESHLDAGDPSNNSVRVNANEINAKIIAEGANLAITQKGRIEYELAAKGRINTDAIDNSAGVNMSDYEVNIKIMLAAFQQNGIIKNNDKRNQLLETATNEVTSLVLQNNISQHMLISMDQYRSSNQPFLIDHTISELIDLGRLNYIDEQIPNSKERQELYKQQIPLPRCVIAKVQAFVKMRLKESIIGASFLKRPFYAKIFHDYFPKSIAVLNSHDIFYDHQLKDHIICTQLVNYFVGVFGCNAHNAITFSGQIPPEKAVDQLVKLEYIFATKKKRKELIEAWELDPTHSDVFDLNQSLLNANLLCHVLNIQLKDSSLEDYKRERAHINSNLPLSLACLFFNKSSKKSLSDLLDNLDNAIGIIHNIRQLESFSPVSHVLHQQKVSVLSDLYSALKTLISISKKDQSSVYSNLSQSLSPITSQNDLLPNLFLYSFNLRRHLASVNQK
ncbi:MAG: NAD-glutamate dehydrogenase [Candidatus Margulisbacteria bacterium]|nr:NAD-glutamate dehydrogenase [Candidatus Margulisiibacteriota bacterium]